MNLPTQNDLFRSTMIQTPRQRVLLTEGVSCSENREAVITAVRNFCAFSPDNDPHGEHDFGAVTVQGERYFWRIDYYDTELVFGADPSGPHAKVLTIMRADEY